MVVGLVLLLRRELRRNLKDREICDGGSDRDDYVCEFGLWMFVGVLLIIIM